MNIKIISIKIIKKIGFLTVASLFLLNACNGKLPGGDARKFPADPKLRVKQNLEQGKVYIIQITKHVLVMDTRDWTTIDNQVPEWRAMDASHHWGKRLVHAFYEVENPKFESQCDEQFTFDFELAS